MTLTQSSAQLLTDVTVVIHFLFVLYVLFGALLLLKWPKLVWLHLPCAIWGMMIEFMGWLCPLTPLENYFRQAAGLEMYSGDFVMQYVMPILYPQELTRNIQLVFGLVVLLLNIFIYSYLIRRWLQTNRSD